MTQPAATRDLTVEWETTIRNLEDQGRRAFLERDIATLDRLWSDSLHVNSPLSVIHPGATVRGLRRRFTNVWRLEEGSWKLIARHANLVPAADLAIRSAISREALPVRPSR